MGSKTDWESKYKELRAKYMNAIDVAFRTGVEEGMRTAEMENLQNQVAEMEEAAAMEEEAALMGEEGMVDENGMPIEEEMPMEEGMEGEELPEEPDLDSSIDELEGFVKKEKEFDVSEIMKKMHKSETKLVKSEKVEKLNKLMDKISK